MLSSNDLRNGTLFTYEGDPWKVTKFEHIFQGRGRGKINIHAKNLRTGNVRMIAFQASDSVEEADIQKRKFTFKYRSREDAVFSNDSEELSIPLEQVKWDVQFLTKDQEVWVLFFADKPLGLILPPTVILTVKKTDPGVKGDTVSNTLKPAIMSTGLNTKVPFFVDEGDNIIVGTEEGDYRGRA